MAILSQPYGGRAPCVQCGFCEGFGCEMQAKSSTLVTVIWPAVGLESLAPLSTTVSVPLPPCPWPSWAAFSAPN